MCIRDRNYTVSFDNSTIPITITPAQLTIDISSPDQDANLSMVYGDNPTSVIANVREIIGDENTISGLVDGDTISSLKLKDGSMGGIDDVIERDFGINNLTNVYYGGGNTPTAIADALTLRKSDANALNNYDLTFADTNIPVTITPAQLTIDIDNIDVSRMIEEDNSVLKAKLITQLESTNNPYITGFKNNDNAVGIINDLNANYGSVNDQSEAGTYANQLSLANVSLNNPNYSVATTSNLGDIIITDSAGTSYILNIDFGTTQITYGDGLPDTFATMVIDNHELLDGGTPVNNYTLDDIFSPTDITFSASINPNTDVGEYNIGDASFIKGYYTINIVDAGNITRLDITPKDDNFSLPVGVISV